MSRKILSLIIFLTIVSCVSYIFYLNPGAVTVKLGPGNIKEAPLALVLIVTFCLGAIITALIALAFGLQQMFHNWITIRRMRQHQHHQDLLVVAREQLAAKNFDAALRSFRRIVEENPDNIVARILLAKTYRDADELENAIKTLDAARQSDKQNIELLFLAADIHMRFGNYTSAYDNLTLILQLQPENDHALTQIVGCCRELDRFDEAIEFQKKLIRHGAPEDQELYQGELAALELAEVRNKYAGNRIELRKQLDEVLRHHKNFAPALSELAFLERDNGELTTATKLWSKAFKFSNNVEYLERLAKTWIKVNDPEKAILVVKNAVLTRDTFAGKSIAGNIFIINLLLHLAMVDQARLELERLRAPEDQEAALGPLEKLQLRVLEASLLRQQGRIAEAFDVMAGAAAEKIEVPGDNFFRTDTSVDGAFRRSWTEQDKLKLQSEPPPRLSTP